MTEPVVRNRIRELQVFRVNPGQHSVESHICWLERGAYFFDAVYQRPYVWKKKEQQQFLKTLVSGFPLGNVAVAKHDDWDRRDGPWLEVVDGKQRLTTINLFITDEIPFILPDGKSLYWSDMTRGEQLAFGNPFLPVLTLEQATDKQILDYFIAVNFSGVPQSNAHKQAVLKMRGEIQ